MSDENGRCKILICDKDIICNIFPIYYVRYGYVCVINMYDGVCTVYYTWWNLLTCCVC